MQTSSLTLGATLLGLRQRQLTLERAEFVFEGHVLPASVLHSLFEQTDFIHGERRIETTFAVAGFQDAVVTREIVTDKELLRRAEWKHRVQTIESDGNCGLNSVAAAALRALAELRREPTKAQQATLVQRNARSPLNLPTKTSPPRRRAVEYIMRSWETPVGTAMSALQIHDQDADWDRELHGRSEGIRGGDGRGCCGGEGSDDAPAREAATR